jgi:hypothetical protein
MVVAARTLTRRGLVMYMVSGSGCVRGFVCRGGFCVSRS